ncbi:MAG: hypothetical protein MK008_03850 [Bdellovibrionales bacterium]|nr:hypothetical protein [Bdellovibrionales bacterium]
MSDKKRQILKFIFKVGIDLKTLVYILEYDVNKIKAWFTNVHDNSLNEALLKQLTNFFKITEDQILLEKYNCKNLRFIYFGKKFDTEPPEKYKEYSYSKTRTSAHILKYLSLTRGQHFSDDLIQSFNISPTFFDSLDNEINLVFFIELLEKVKPLISQKEYNQLGCLLFLGIKNSTLGKEFASKNNYYSCYNTLIKNLNLFDNNFIYNTQLTPEKLIFQARLNNENIEPLNIDNQRLSNITFYRKTLLEWIPYLSELAPLQSKINKCITQGDSYTEYEFELPKAHSLFLL